MAFRLMLDWSRTVNLADAPVESYLWLALGIVLIAAHPTELAAWSAVGLFVQKSFFQQQQQQKKPEKQKEKQPDEPQEVQQLQRQPPPSPLRPYRRGSSGGVNSDYDYDYKKTSSIDSSSSSQQPQPQPQHHYYAAPTHGYSSEPKKHRKPKSRKIAATTTTCLYRQPQRPPQGIAILILTCLFTITRQYQQHHHSNLQSSSSTTTTTTNYYSSQFVQDSWWRPRTFAWMVPWVLSLSQTASGGGGGMMSAISSSLSSSSKKRRRSDNGRRRDRRQTATAERASAFLSSSTTTRAWIRLCLALLGVWCHAAWQWYAVGKMLVGHWACALLEQVPALHGVFTIDEWQVVSFLGGAVWLEWMDMLVRARKHDSSRYDSHHAVIACAGNMGVWLATSLVATSTSDGTGSSKKATSAAATTTTSQSQLQPSSHHHHQQQKGDKLLSLATQLAVVIGLPAVLIEVSLVLVQAPSPWTGIKTLDWLLVFLFQIESPLWNFSALPIPRILWVVYWGLVTFMGVRYAPGATVSFAGTTSTSNGSTTNGSGNKLLFYRTTVARKWFHAIACLLFTPVTLYAPILQSTGYAVACALLVLAESLRRNVPAWNAFVASYVDRRKEDAGAVVVSHLALIAGCALPLWCYEFGSAALLPPVTALLGVCTLGVGDACAAVVGTYAAHHWKAHVWSRNSTRRTLEGSLAMGIGQLIFLMVLSPWIPIPWSSSIAAVIFVTLLEAWTTHMDNIVLPMATTAFFCLWQQAFV